VEKERCFFRWLEIKDDGWSQQDERELINLQTQEITLDMIAKGHYKKVQHQKQFSNMINLDDEELEDIVEEYEAV
jgi:hypothetical protein